MKKQLLLILILVLIGIINYPPNLITWGFDNSSPYFSFSTTLFRIFNSENFFYYGGHFFLPTFWISALPIPPQTVSAIGYITTLVIGGYFISHILDKYQETPWYVSMLLILGTLCSHFVFSIPTQLFAPAFAGIPSIIYLFTTSKLKSKYETVLLIIGLLYFSSTLINPVAFILFFIQAILLSVNIARTDDIDSSISSKRRILKLGIAYLFIFSIAVQTLLLFSQSKSSVISEIIEYGYLLKRDTRSSIITDSILSMEIKSNSLINSARFATGWSRLTDGRGNNLYRYSDSIDSTLGILITLIPFGYSLLSTKIRPSSTNNRLAFIMLFGTVLSSGYFTSTIQWMPYLSEILRWNSSKFWPLVFFPSLILLSQTLVNQPRQVRIPLLIALSIIALPWITGTLVSDSLQTKLPQYYQAELEELAEENTILYIPEPSRIYMRQYMWGYYGSSFLTYLTKAKVYDNGTFEPHQLGYNLLIESYLSCKLLTQNDFAITHVIIDKSIETSYTTSTIPDCYKSLSTENNNLVIINTKWQK